MGRGRGHAAGCEKRLHFKHSPINAHIGSQERKGSRLRYILGIIQNGVARLWVHGGLHNRVLGRENRSGENGGTIPRSPSEEQRFRIAGLRSPDSPPGSWDLGSSPCLCWGGWGGGVGGGLVEIVEGHLIFN